MSTVTIKGERFEISGGVVTKADGTLATQAERAKVISALNRRTARRMRDAAFLSVGMRRGRTSTGRIVWE